MTQGQASFIELLAILVGVALTHLLFLYAEFYQNSRGYMWRAARKVWGFLLMSFLVEWTMGIFGFLLLVRSLNNSLLQLVLAVIVGVLVAVIPIVLETRLLTNTMTVERLQSRFVRLILKMNLALRYNFAWAIQTSIQQDVFDSQTPKAWGLDLTPSDIRRRLRILYEVHKFKIAEQRQDPSFLSFHDKGTPWSMFYILVRHLGRSGLREALMNPPPSPSQDWNGLERRRVRGTKNERRNSDSSESRIYDDPQSKDHLSVADNSSKWTEQQDGTEERQGYRALAATWPLGPTILHLLNEAPLKTTDLQTLFPTEDIRSVLSILEAANLVRASVDQIENPDQGNRLYRSLKSLVPGPTILHIIDTQPHWTNNVKYVMPSAGLSTVFFGSLGTGTLVEFADFSFELSEIGKCFVNRLSAQE